jgi:hypothetical protein
MEKYSLILLSLLFNLSIWAQPDTLYYNSDWHLCNPDSAEYFRVVQIDSLGNLIGKTYDHYITGELQWEGRFYYFDKEDDNKNKHEGLCTWYYKNGQKSRESTFIHDTIDGMTSYWHENGNIAKRVKYRMGEYDGIWASYFLNGKLSRLYLFSEGYQTSPFFIDCVSEKDYKKIFIEDFESDKNYNWWPLIKDKPTLKMEILAEKGLHITNLSDTTYIQHIKLPTNGNDYFKIESDIEVLNGKNQKYGLVWELKDTNNYHYFILKPNGMFSVGAVVEGIDITYKEWTKSEYIHKQKASNKLSIICKGGDVVWAINDHMVFRDIKRYKWGSGYGFYASNTGEIIYKNLIITEDLYEIKDIDDDLADIDLLRWRGAGSAFFVNRKGLLATCYHVVEDANNISIFCDINGQKKEYKAKILKSDKKNDLALLQITDPDYIAPDTLPYQVSNTTTSIGENVFALGYPMSMSVMGEDVKFTDGKISSKTGFQDDVTTYQITVPIQSGNSGGPLFDYNGNIIGVNSSKLYSFVAENVAYSVKSNYLKTLIETLPVAEELPLNNELEEKTLPELVNKLTKYVVLVKVK